MKFLRSSFPYIPEQLSGLVDLSENLWWSWNPSARMLFKTLDRQGWKESGHNPDKMLREIPSAVLDNAANNPEYVRYYNLVISRFRRYLGEKAAWCSGAITNHDHDTIVYFSAEYGLHHSLPFYAGGLGFLAGDHLKECSDLRVPLVAVGFMYPEGYLHQKIREDGWQENTAQILNREVASIAKVLDDEDNHIIVKVPFIIPPIYVAVWRVAVGRISLFLMDTDIEQNDPWNRGISARLYTGDIEQRLRQEIVLGIGGSEVLEKMGIQQPALHLNEGHAVFAQLERIRDRVKTGMTFETAFDQVRRTTVFTTHTPVPAGHDVFPFYLMEKYFQSYWPSLGIDRDRFFQLGIHPENPGAGFNMTAFALRMSKYNNGVSKKHGEVTRRMWKSLWPDAPEEAVPIDHITNGIHVPTWVEPKVELLFNKYLGADWLENHDDPVRWEFVHEIPDDELWKTHYWLKIKLIDAIREKVRHRWMYDRISPSMTIAGGTLLEPSILTIGFARRFAAYKRADLLFRQPERLKKLLNDRWRPIQIIFAGKAHPADDPGKRILQRVYNESRNPEMAGRIAFVENYGEQMAQYMVHGVDVWLNNPLPPMEACGTSGMKAALNGVPNLSIMDGWWIEGYNGGNGWAFGHKDMDGNRDDRDAEDIYRILEDEVIPRYYKVSEEGIPTDWVAIMKETIKSAGSNFSARKMVKSYIDKFYVHALKEL